MPYRSFDQHDFVYFDPPYYGTGGVGYENIDHNKLCEVLAPAKFRWVLSGYDNELYRQWFGPPVGERTQAAHMTVASGKTGLTRTECVWRSKNLN